MTRYLKNQIRSVLVTSGARPSAIENALAEIEDLINEERRQARKRSTERRRIEADLRKRVDE